MSPYFEALRPELEALEGQRKTTMVTIVAVVGTIAALSLAFFWGPIHRSAFTAAFMVLWNAAPAYYVYKHFQKRFGKTFKSRVITRLVAMVDPSLQYNATGGLGQESFDRSRLYFGAYSSYHAEDLVWGTVSDTEFGFCELNVTRGAGKSEVTVFKGLFFEFALAAPMPSRVTLRATTTALGALGKMFEGLNGPPPGERVRFEAEFDAVFEVYAKNEEVARQVLTTPTRKRLLALRKKVDAPVSVGFVDDKCYLGVAKKEDQFEPRIFRSLVDPRAIQAYLDTLQMVTGMVQDLNPKAAARRASAEG